MKAIRRLAFVVNQTKSGAQQLARKLVAIAEKSGVATSLLEGALVKRGSLKGCDACCVIGGDGTLLGTAREAALEKVPVIGVNRGSLGFLTTFSADEALAQLPAVLSGKYEISKRSLLTCCTAPGQEDIALNDVIIRDERNGHLVRLGVYADGEFVTDYNGDGLIFSTPTGSTAYNLSAGGPILHPDAGVVAMTPICPHTLSNRSVIFREGVALRVENRSANSRILVAMDGQRNLVTVEGHAIQITLARQTLSLVQKPGYQHFDVVRTKLGWSGEATALTKR